MTTSQNEPGSPAKDNHNPPEETQQFAGRSPRSRSKSRSSRSRFKIGRLWIGLSVIVLLGLSAALITYATGGTKQAASSGSPGSPGPSQTGGSALGTARSTGGTAPRGGTSTAKGKVVSAAKLAQQGGALSPPTNIQGSVESWQSGSGGRELTAVSARLGAALQAGGIKQYTPMRSACIQLASSVAAAEAGPQIPDAAMQALYTKALGDLAKGAADCRTAISIKTTGDETTQANLDTATFHQATAELSAGATDIFRSTAEIEILSRQHH
jgi:hypothetical protein